MRLSEAMRKGAKMGRQVHSKWSDDTGGGCALTLTAYGVGINAPGVFAAMALMEIFPQLRDQTVKCYCGNYEAALWHMIMHLNDVHLWTADRIAGWIEATIEVPTYSMLQIQEFMGEPIMDPVEVLRV